MTPLCNQESSYLSLPFRPNPCSNDSVYDSYNATYGYDDYDAAYAILNATPHGPSGYYSNPHVLSPSPLSQSWTYDTSASASYSQPINVQSPTNKSTTYESQACYTHSNHAAYLNEQHCFGSPASSMSNVCSGLPHTVGNGCGELSNAQQPILFPFTASPAWPSPEFPPHEVFDCSQPELCFTHGFRAPMHDLHASSEFATGDVPTQAHLDWVGQQPAVHLELGNSLLPADTTERDLEFCITRDFNFSRVTSCSSENCSVVESENESLPQPAPSSHSFERKLAPTRNPKRRKVDEDAEPARKKSSSSKFAREHGMTTTLVSHNCLHVATTGIIEHGTSSQRPFTCPLQPYGCTADFATKNEWKRHVQSQHVLLGFWRCQQCLKPNGRQNDFNRKDLFKEHLRRMHVPEANRKAVATAGTANQARSTSSSTSSNSKSKSRTKQRGQDSIEQYLEEVAQRSWLQIRQPATYLHCFVCGEDFTSETATAQWLEHVGHHLAVQARATKASNGGVKSEDAIAHDDVHAMPSALSGPTACPLDWTREVSLKAWFVRQGVLEPSGNGGLLLAVESLRT